MNFPHRQDRRRRHGRGLPRPGPLTGTWRSRCCPTPLLTGFFCLAFAQAAWGQFVTVGGGVLATNRSTDAAGELHGETPPFAETRGYVTASWIRESAKPTLITAVERPVLHVGRASVGLGAGLLWLEANDYQPYPMLVSSTVVPLPVPRTSLVLIGSTLPFEDFDWSLVVKVGVTLWFVR